MNDQPRFDLDPGAPAPPSAPPGPITSALVVGGGFLIGGPFGAAVAIAALFLWRRYPQWLGGLTAGLLALAAIASIIGNWPNGESLRQSFADDRSWAAAAGLAAGVGLLAVVVRAARDDRAPDPRPPIGDAADGNANRD